MKSFFDSLTYTVGFPCPHRNQKNYIEMEGILTWAHVYNLYLNFLVENLSVPAGEQITRISDSDYKKGKLDSATVSMHSDSENEKTFLSKCFLVFLLSIYSLELVFQVYL